LEAFSSILDKLRRAQQSVLIGTYNLQDIRFDVNGYRRSLSEVIKRLLKRQVKVLICLAPFMQHSRFMQNLRTKYAENQDLFVRFCRRMHFKTIVVDLEYAYLGSGNLSGAGVGMKSIRKRNFELGLISENPDLIADITFTFMEIFNGKYCNKENCHFFKNTHIQGSCNGILVNSI
jgi:phosphatidylserine/phosphatidylglycerophosphate/cardiolipin synthase-like enzyme